MEAISDVYREWITDVLEASDENRKNTLHKLHRAILDALRSGDMERCEEAIDKHYNNRVGGYPLIEYPTSHTTVRTVRYTAVQ